jgi:DNA primase large subunit
LQSLLIFKEEREYLMLNKNNKKMKLAEALSIRTDLQKRISQLRERLKKQFQGTGWR